METARMDFLQGWLDKLEAHAAACLQRHGRPLVTLSYAQSLDGCLTDRRGQPFAISGPRALDVTHALRAVHSAVLIGAGTALADNPQLNVRRVAGTQPHVVILDTRLRTPPEARVFHTDDRDVFIIAAAGADKNRTAQLQAAGAQVLQFPLGPDGRPSLPAVLTALGEREIHSLMVEGGAAVITAFMQQRLADWAVITLAPLFLGGLGAVEHPLGPPFPRLENPAWERCDSDCFVWGRMTYDSDAHFEGGKTDA